MYKTMVTQTRACGYKQLVVLSVLMFGHGMAEVNCPGPAELYIKRGPSLLCRKYFNCKPGNEILPCQSQCEQERCVQCQEGMEQPYLIHSSSGDEDRKCFKPKNVCSDLENIATRYQHNTACRQDKAFCECDVYNCYFGNPCICSRHIPKCQENEYLVVHDMKNAECLPCPPGTYKPEKGCQPCHVREETMTKKINMSTIATVTSIHSPQNQVTTTLTITTEKQLSTSARVQTTQKPQNREKIPVDVIIGLLVTIVVVFVVAIILCCVMRRSRRGQVCIYSCIDANVCCERQLMLPLPTEEMDTSSSVTDVKLNYTDDVKQNSVPQSPMEETENPLPAHPNEIVQQSGNLVPQTEIINSNTVSGDQTYTSLSILTLEHSNLESANLSNEIPYVTQESNMGQIDIVNDKKDFNVSIDMDAENGIMNSEHQSSNSVSSILNMKDKGQEHEEDTERKIPVDPSECDSSVYKSAALLVPGDSASSCYIDIKGPGNSKEENVKYVTEQCSPDENTKLLNKASVKFDVSHEGKENEEETQPKLLYETEDDISANIANTYTAKNII